MAEGAVEVRRDTSLGRVKKSEDVLVGVDEVVAVMLGEGVVQIEFSGDSSAERVVDEFQPRRAVLGADEPVFGIICVGRGVELGHVAVIVVQRTDAASPGNIDFGVLVQTVRVIGLRGGILVGTGAVSDVVEEVAHVVLRHVGGVFTDGAGDFGPLIVGVVPGCIVLKRCGCPATEGVVDVSGLIGRVGVDEGKTVVCVVGVGDGEEGGACALLPSLHQGQIGLVEVGIGDGGGIVFDRGVASCGGIVGVDGRGRTFEENGLRTTNGVVSPGNRGAGVRGKRELFGGHFAVGVVSRGLGACAVAAADFAPEGGKLFVDGGMTERALERVRGRHWRGNQRFSPKSVFDLCVSRRHF